MKISCSKGTYIRAIARDIAYDLNTFGYLESLKRISIGEFDKNNYRLIYKTTYGLDGEVDGKSHYFYYENGQIKKEENYKDGKLTETKEY